MATADITHTTKPSDRPWSGARLLVDTDSGVRAWTEEPPAEPEPLPEPTPEPKRKSKKNGA